MMFESDFLAWSHKLTAATAQCLFGSHGVLTFFSETLFQGLARCDKPSDQPNVLVREVAINNEGHNFHVAMRMFSKSLSTRHETFGHPTNFRKYDKNGLQRKLIPSTRTKSTSAIQLIFESISVLVLPAPNRRSSHAAHQSCWALRCTLQSWSESATSTNSRWSIPASFEN